jgi:hypothetical protein
METCHGSSRRVVAEGSQAPERLQLQDGVAVSPGDGQHSIDGGDVVGVVPECHGARDAQAQARPGDILDIL